MEQKAAVSTLESEIHLQATVVAVTGVSVPRTLTAMDTKPLRLVRDMRGASPNAGGSILPEPKNPAAVG
jgi:hypothetical protein